MELIREKVSGQRNVLEPGVLEFTLIVEGWDIKEQQPSQ